MLDLAMAAIDVYFRLEAITQAIAGFAQAGGDYGLLRLLIQNGPQTVPELARLRPISRQHCQTIINGLADGGYIEFVENPKHKRSHLVRVTKKGRANFEQQTLRFLTAAAVYAPHFEEKEVQGAVDVLNRARDLIKV
jgi:DNA-binding MarR family transcriptional regulator